MDVRAGELRIGQFPAVRIEFQRAFTGQHDAAVLRKLAQLRGRLRERVRRVGDRDDLEGAGAALDEFLFGDDRDRQLAAQEGVVPVEAVLLVGELLVSAHGMRLPPDRRQRVEDADFLRDARIRQRRFGQPPDFV